MVDIVRIDHFRGFEALLGVPAGDETAQNGDVGAGSRARRSSTRRETALGDLPIIAEDSGLITPEVDALREAFGLPGMAVLQFAFGSGADNLYLPHNLRARTTSSTPARTTTTRRAAGIAARRRAHARPSCAATWRPTAHDIAWDCIRAALGRRCADDRHRAAAGCARPRQRGAHELARPARRQLDLAHAARRADR